MMNLFKLTILILVVLWQSQAIKAENRLDSLLQERNSQYNEYNQYKLSMNERTWLRLVELGQKANDLIETDNVILNQYLQRELSRNRELIDSTEKMNLEIALLNKEAEMQEMLMVERRNLTNTLLIIIGGIVILLIVLFILFIDRQSRFRSAKLELERLWTMKEDPKYNHLQQDELKMLSDQVNKLAEENDLLKKELNQEKGKKSEAMESLKKEIRSRRQVEQEIKDLISQIQKK
ncbi:MAG: hypothetical protein KQI35_18035 [Bacteroidetes bacterium]|nr:hypothetical protein [Bacteroidota bacterium]